MNYTLDMKNSSIYCIVEEICFALSCTNCSIIGSGIKKVWLLCLHNWLSKDQSNWHSSLSAPLPGPSANYEHSYTLMYFFVLHGKCLCLIATCVADVPLASIVTEKCYNQRQKCKFSSLMHLLSTNQGSMSLEVQEDCEVGHFCVAVACSTKFDKWTQLVCTLFLNPLPYFSASNKYIARWGNWKRG